MGKSEQFANSRHLIRRSIPKKNNLFSIRTQEVIENKAKPKKREPESNPSGTQANPKNTQENPAETEANPRNYRPNRPARAEIRPRPSRRSQHIPARRRERDKPEGDNN